MRQAEQDGKPQQAVSLLTTLDTIALNNCDTLEHLEVLDRICRNVSQYNWKEAGKWESLYNETWDRINHNLDNCIETYHDHPRVTRLILAKIEQLKGAEDCLEIHTPDGYANIRRMCALAQELFPESEQCAAFKDIVRQMDSRELYVKSAAETLYPGESVEFVLGSRNTDSVRMEIFRTGTRCRLTVNDQPLSSDNLISERIAEEKISSSAGEYNVCREISHSFTFDNPGIYLVRFSADGLESWCRIYVSRVAVALRGSGASKQIYVADGRTGKPFPRADVQIFKDDDTETMQYDSSALLSQKSYKLNGFTDLRQQLFPRDNRFSNLAVAVGEDVWSAPMHLWKESGPGRRVESETHYIYTDRKLYRPADTIEFKLIAVKSDGSAGKVLAGQKVNVELRNASQKEAVGVLSLETNPMGSAVGRFVIPEDARLGRWWISSRYGSSNFRIEEYKDPGFSIKLSNVEGAYGFDSQIVQKGTVASYTGVPVADAEVSYKISQIKVWGQSNGLEEIKGVVLTDKNGGFEIPFVVPAPDDGKIGTIMATIEATVTSPSGETRQQSKYLQISRQRLNMAIEFPNDYKDKSFSIVDKGKEHSFTTTVRNNDGASLPVRGSWRLISKGKSVASGEYTAEEPVSIDFSKLPGGGYQLECNATLDGCTLCDTLDLAVFSPDDKRPPVPCETFFYPVKDKDGIDFVIGSSSELYVEVELFDNGKVVERRAVHVENALERISLPYKSSYRDEVVVSVFGFRNMERVELSHRFGRTIPSQKFDLKVSSLRDFTTPATTETFTVEAPSSELMVSVYDVTSDRYGANRFAFNPIRKYYASKPYISTNIGPSFKIRGLGYTKSAGKFAAAMPNTFGAVEEAGFVSDSFASQADMSDRETASLEADTDETEDVTVREDFGQTLAFLSQIEVREGIPSEIKFTTRDGLSTFRVLMLAHTADLRSGSASREIVVRREVMVMPQLPLFATVGDKIAIKAPVSNQTDGQINGAARLVLTDAESGKELDLGTKEVALTIPAGGSANAEWEVVVPQVGRLGVEIRYVAEGFSDAEKRIVEIVPSVKTLTEARSFIIGGGVTKEDCIAE
ncbi:MAG: hypothetical protein HUJ91_06695, partial [Bacteroidales bacterium]|nr:hypothetical protein [Bacteroidales bacterium]